jgi:hypothetical protein
MRALLFWLLPALALAQAIPPSAPAATAVKAADLRTSATLTLYVDPTGSDANACTATGAAACQTIAGALAKVPSELCDSVTINIASGNYTGFYIDRFRPCSLESGSRTGSLTLNGTLIPATLATGSGTFNFTSQTVGTSLGNTWGLLNNTGATWTVNDLRGKVLEASALAVLAHHRLQYRHLPHRGGAELRERQHVHLVGNRGLGHRHHHRRHLPGLPGLNQLRRHGDWERAQRGQLADPRHHQQNQGELRCPSLHLLWRRGERRVSPHSLRDDRQRH